MISARTARIGDNLRRGTDGSNPVPSSVEAVSLPELLSLVCLDYGYRGKTLTGIAPEVYY